MCDPAAPKSAPRGEEEPGSQPLRFRGGLRPRSRGREHWQGDPAAARAPEPGAGETRGPSRAAGAVLPEV